MVTYLYLHQSVLVPLASLLNFLLSPIIYTTISVLISTNEISYRNVIGATQGLTEGSGKAELTTIPIRTFSPPAFSSTASSRTMLRNT